MHHRIGGDRAVTAGPVELTWSDRRCTTIDAAADWKLVISSGPWRDPFSTASATERLALEREIGLWKPEIPKPDEPLAQLVGRSVTSAQCVVNEVGELTGVDVSFGPITLAAHVSGGEIAIDVSRTK